MDINTRVIPATIIVVNPGTHPEPRALAKEFAARGHKVAYFTGSQLSRTGGLYRLANLLGPRVRKLIAKRLLPSEFSDLVDVRTVGLVLEFCFQFTPSRFFKLSRAFMVMRSRHVSKAAARMARSVGDQPKIIVAQQTSGAKIFVREEAAFKVLMQPIVSQGWLERQLANESLKNPEWSFALQGLDRDKRQLADLSIEAAHADLFLAGSQLVADSLHSDNLRPVSVHHYGVSNSTKLDPQVRRLPARGKPLRLLFVGQVNQRKGISYLLSAMSELRDIAVLDIVGRASIDVTAKIKDLELENVSLLGVVGGSDVAGIYLNHDVLVLPSLGEGFSLVVPEAMATGLPCIVSDKAGSHEVVQDGHNGFIVPTQDAASIIRRVREIADTPGLLERLSVNAELAGKQLTWERFGREAVDSLLNKYEARKAD